jgi:hypothetical protein
VQSIRLWKMHLYSLRVDAFRMTNRVASFSEIQRLTRKNFLGYNSSLWMFYFHVVEGTKSYLWVRRDSITLSIDYISSNHAVLILYQRCWNKVNIKLRRKMYICVFPSSYLLLRQQTGSGPGIYRRHISPYSRFVNSSVQLNCGLVLILKIRTLYIFSLLKHITFRLIRLYIANSVLKSLK